MIDLDNKARKRKVLYTASGLIIVAVAAGVFCTMLVNSGVTGSALKAMRKAGLEEPRLRVDSVGPFYASAADIGFKSGPLLVEEGRVEASFLPMDLVGAGQVEAITIDSLRAKLDVDALMAEPRAEGAPSPLEIPFTFVPMLDLLPSHSLLVRDAGFNISAGGRNRNVRLDALVRQPSSGVRSATFSASSDEGDQILVTVEGRGGKDTVNAEGSVDLFGWLLDSSRAQGFELPQDVALEAAPLVFQFLVEQEGLKPGKWVGVVSQPWFQYEQGQFLIWTRDMRAGMTGDASGLAKAAAEGDMLIRSGAVSIGPMHPSLSATDFDSVSISARDLPVRGERGSMKLDYVKGTAYLPEGGGDYSLRGSFKPDWLPQPLEMAVSAPNTLDGVFVDISLPRCSLDKVRFPVGWLPSIMDGLEFGGQMDADLFISAGGLTAGGFSASGRISADAAWAGVPTGPFAMEAVMVRNARISSIKDGISLELPEGVRIGRLGLGTLAISELQVWPSHLSFPGQLGIGSVTAMFYGGRFISGEIRGRVDSQGQLTLSSPFEANCTGIDLSSLASGLLSRQVLMGGTADIALSVRPGGPLSFPALDASLGIRSDSMSLSLPGGGVSISTGAMDLSLGSSHSESGGSVLRVDMPRTVELRSISAAGARFSGAMRLGGWVQLSLTDVVALAIGRGASGLGAALDFGTRGCVFEYSPSGIRAEGVDLSAKLRVSAGKPELHTEKLAAKSLSIGDLRLENLVAALSYSFEEGLKLGELKASFYGGQVWVDNLSFVESDSSIAVSLRIENVSIGQLLALFPSFKGRAEGRIDGVISLRWVNGELVIFPGRMSLRSGENASLSYDDPDALMSGMDVSGFARDKIRKAISKLLVSSFSLEIKADPDAPIFIRLVGRGDERDGLPVDLNLTLNGDISDAIGEVLGKGIKVRFANAGK